MCIGWDCMRRKLFDNTLTCISALCVFQIIRDIGNNVISDDVSPFINIIITLGEIIIFLMKIFIIRKGCLLIYLTCLKL